MALHIPHYRCVLRSPRSHSRRRALKILVNQTVSFAVCLALAIVIKCIDLKTLQNQSLLEMDFLLISRVSLNVAVYCNPEKQ